jgi:transcriptional regulator with XRE-family HTH domain
MTGRQLREALRIIGYTQSEFAKMVGRTQKAVSLWVNGSKDIPAEFASQIEQLVREKAPDALHLIAHPPIASDVNSWPQELFDLLWNDAGKRKRAKQVTVDATITEERSTGFATVEIRMRFQELELGPNERLYLDHLGLPEKVGGPTEWAEPALGQEAKRARLLADPNIVIDIGPQAVAYEIYNADRLDDITVHLSAKRGFRLDDFDAIGFPLYGDFVLERLMLNVQFKGLIPEPDPPTAQLYLIRRTAFRSRPSGLSSDLDPPVREEREDGLHYSFGPLLRPRSGYSYCLTWANLKRDS